MLTDLFPSRRARAHATRVVVTALLVAIAPAACARPSQTVAVAPQPAPAPADPPPSFVASNADSKTTRTFDVRDGWFKPALFSAASDALSSTLVVDVSDPHAGFLMTTWQASSVHSGVPDPRYRTRVILRFIGSDWKQAQVKVEANWRRGDEWEVGTDAPLLDQVTDELRAKIGKP